MKKQILIFSILVVILLNEVCLAQPICSSSVTACTSCNNVGSIGLNSNCVPLCKPQTIYTKINLIIRVGVKDANGLYQYGKNTFSADISVRPSLNTCSPATTTLFDVNPYNTITANDHTILFTLNEKKPESVYKLSIDKDTWGQSMLNGLNYQAYMTFAISASNVNGVNLEDIKLDFSFEEELARHEVSAVSFVDPWVSIAQGKATFYWTIFNKKPLYQLQVMRLYNTDPAKKTQTNITVKKSDVRWDRAFTINVTGDLVVGTNNVLPPNSVESTSLTLAEGTGFYIWRYRTIDNQYPGGDGNPSNWRGWWSTGYIDYYPNNEVPITNSVGNGHIFYYDQFDDDKNWIYSRHLIESESKFNNEHKPNLVGEGITYANGLGMVKQTQSISNSIGEVLVSNSYQDYIGRTSLTTLASTTAGNATGHSSLGYIDNLGGNFGVHSFDANGNFQSPPTFNYGSGITDYYSNANADLNVPNADGYAYTRTLYDRDPLNRVRETSMPGATHRIQPKSVFNTHTNRSLEGSVSDIELIRIFGDEAPPDSSVHKMVSIDANNSLSISYISKTGKTIATCLSLPISPYLKAIPNPDSSTFEIKHKINAHQQYDEYISASKKLTFEDVTDLKFSYKLLKKVYEDKCIAFCKTCDYDIEFSLANVDSIDNPVWCGKVVVDPVIDSCNDLSGTLDVLSFQAPLCTIKNDSCRVGAGTYILTKSIHLYNTNPVTKLKYKVESENEVRDSLESKLWLEHDSLNKNWQVFDGTGINAIQVGGNNLFVNLHRLRTQLLNEKMNGDLGVFKMLGINPYNDSSNKRVLKHINTSNPTCNEEISLDIQSCNQTNCGDTTIFILGLINSLSAALNDPNILGQFSLTVAHHFKLYNSLFGEPSPLTGAVNSTSSPLGWYINLTELELKQIIKNMLSDPDMPYTCSDLQKAWLAAIEKYVFHYKYDSISGNGGFSIKDNFLSLFFSNAGYHFSCGTDVPGDATTIGYKTHPYRCFYYRDINSLSTWVTTNCPPPPASGTATMPLPAAVSVAYFNRMYKRTGCPLLLVNDVLTYVTNTPANNFNPNFNINSYPPSTNCGDKDEEILLNFFNSIQFQTNPDVPSTLNMSIPPSLDELLQLISEQEEVCRNICETRRSDFRDKIAESIQQHAISIANWPTLTTDWFKAEGYNTVTIPSVANANLASTFASSNWIDVFVQQAEENCKSKCVLNISQHVSGKFSIDDTKTTDFVKPFGWDVKFYPFKNMQDLSASSTDGCTECKDAFGTNYTATNCGTATFLNNVMSNTLLEISNAYPLPKVSGKLYSSCCGDSDPALAQYPMESSDPTRNKDWANRLMLSGDRLYSSVYLMLFKLQQIVGSHKQNTLGGVGSRQNIDIYPFVYNYLNPIQYTYYGPYSDFPSAPVSDVLKSENTSGPPSMSIPVTHDTSFFSIGQHQTHTIDLPNPVFPYISHYTMTRSHSTQLPLHATMKVDVVIKPKPGYVPPAGEKIIYEEVLKDYNNLTTGTGPAYAPVIEFKTNRKTLKVLKTFRGSAQSDSIPLKLSYYVYINDDYSKDTWNINNLTLKTAHEFCNSPLDPFTSDGANLIYANCTFKTNNSPSASVYNAVVNVPVFRDYNYNIVPDSQSISSNNKPDISLAYDVALNGSGAISYNPLGQRRYNWQVQVVNLYYYYKDSANGPLLGKYLWAMNNFKVQWQHLFCMQWHEYEYPQITDHKILKCEEFIAPQVYNQLRSGVNAIIDKHVYQLDTSYKKQCLAKENLNDEFTVAYRAGYHHYTLYYYDRAGNLVRTVPPEGVDTNSKNRLLPPPHTFVTRYDYNSLNQLEKQSTPDAGVSIFYYDKIGRLRFSQNAEQKMDNRYSYTKYDSLGRIIEVGEMNAPINFNMYDSIEKQNYPGVGIVKSDLVMTAYTTKHNSINYCSDESKPQKNLLNRVSFSISDKDANLATTRDQITTIYSYDVRGNVEWLAQKITDLPPLFTRYEYDIISGSVLQVFYNECDSDAFYHKYTYDTDKRIQKVQTSRNGVLYETDATYQYYKHGPLKSMIIGHDQLQRLDYAYTINGWLKGINNLQRKNQIGAAQVFAPFAMKDIYATKLHYFRGDFNRSYAGIASAFNDVDAYGDSLDAPLPNEDENLYNGNIPAIFTSIHNPDPLAILPDYKYVNLYKYDELNRLVDVKYATPVSTATNKYTQQPAFTEQFTYDANGNIKTAYRRADVSIGFIDSFNYKYTTNTNKLHQVTDDVNTSIAPKLLPKEYDIKKGQSDNNYQYDAIGNLIKDASDTNLVIAWNVYGKIDSIKKGNVMQMQYLYDASGNRVVKRLNRQAATPEAEYYVRDGSGNVMTIYKRSDSMGTTDLFSKLMAYEQPIYGSDRLGVHIAGLVKYNGLASLLPNRALPAPNKLLSAHNIAYRYLDYKRYELKDHLGNVHATFGDTKLSKTDSLFGMSILPYSFSNFKPDQKSMYNLYAFGMPKYGDAQYFDANDMPASMVGVSYKYRYGFNGQEKVNEIAGVGNHNTALFWEYDTRLGRRWNLDPKPTKSAGDYACFSNNPIFLSDPFGDSTDIPRTKSGGVKSEPSQEKPSNSSLSSVTTYAGHVMTPQSMASKKPEPTFEPPTMSDNPQDKTTVNKPNAQQVEAKLFLMQQRFLDKQKGDQTFIGPRIGNPSYFTPYEDGTESEHNLNILAKNEPYFMAKKNLLEGMKYADGNHSALYKTALYVSFAIGVGSIMQKANSSKPIIKPNPDYWSTPPTSIAK